MPLEDCFNCRGRAGKRTSLFPESVWIIGGEDHQGLDIVEGVATMEKDWVMECFETESQCSRAPFPGGFGVNRQPGLEDEIDQGVLRHSP